MSRCIAIGPRRVARRPDPFREMFKAVKTSFLLVLSLACAAPAWSEDLSEQALEDWFNSDDDGLPFAVNEGELEFLGQPPPKPVHHHHNILVISPRSLYDGWVRVKQCHENLDRVERAQVMFHKQRSRDLVVRFAENIERAWVEDSSVQLINVGQGARLCIELETQALRSNGDGTYTLRNGPFLRRFLDGYYPMHVSMDIIFVSKILRFLNVSPKMQEGFRVWHASDSVHYDTWFKGKLTTEIQFVIGTP